ncbi:DNA translocase FtsK 4TM domain-containing protein, partial [Escherichia coli]|uniref:DNA translocase FtsK 4TM domain-containing protein n=1 Tax=Escherichia coli TaxID=562 RepID=UPI001C60BCE6
VVLYKDFRRHAEQALPGSYNRKIAAAALFILTVFSHVLEYFALGGKYGDALPAGAGGMVGMRVGTIFEWLLGKSGSLLIISVVLLLSVSLLVQVSWLDVLDAAGRAVQNFLTASGCRFGLCSHPFRAGCCLPFRQTACRGRKVWRWLPASVGIPSQVW